MSQKRTEFRAGPLQGALASVLQNTVAFLDCPLTDDQMLAVWHDGYPQEVLEALRILRECDFISRTDKLYAYTPVFAVGELGVGMRLCLRGTDARFTQAVAKGRFRRQRRQLRDHSIPVVPWGAFERQLDEPSRKTLIEWVSAAAECSARQAEVKRTIDDLCKMLSTAGQLRRMVPELVGYLPPHLQELVMQQKRASPYPDQWAGYPKDRVERLVTALAEGHLCKGLAKRNVDNGFYSWAEYLPK